MSGVVAANEASGILEQIDDALDNLVKELDKIDKETKEEDNDDLSM